MEPVKDWSLCPLELLKAPQKLLHDPLQLLWAPLELLGALMQPFQTPLGPFCCKYVKLCNFSQKYAILSRNINIRRFWTNNFELNARRIFCWHFYARRRGRILSMPEDTAYSKGDIFNRFTAPLAQEYFKYKNPHIYKYTNTYCTKNASPTFRRDIFTRFIAPRNIPNLQSGWFCSKIHPEIRSTTTL